MKSFSLFSDFTLELVLFETNIDLFVESVDCLQEFKQHLEKVLIKL